MRTLSDGQAKELCLELVLAETEREVEDILRRYLAWDDRASWKPYGDIPNNRGIVGNQQSSPVAAIVEKLVNSVDAVLTAECYRVGIDPRSPDAPDTMELAAERFLGVPGGQIQNLDAGSRTSLAERIQLVASGSKDHPCYSIIDDGEGQAPEQFPATFLSLLRENKTGIPFVQGKFNMGGTGVLQFAGIHSFQLIVSRRQPDIALQYDLTKENLWGFTLIRRMEPAAGQPQSMYVYLAPNGSVLSFSADSLPIRPGRYPEACSEPMTAGTYIKLWDYKFPGRLKTIATLDLRYALERYLQEPALPIRLLERRAGYHAHSYDTTMSGLLAVIADHPEDIEPGLDTGTPLEVPGVGSVALRLVVMCEDVSDVRRYPSGVFFNVNGQLHGEFDSTFLIRKTGLDYLANSMIVIVDCSRLPYRIREDLFLASRDRMRHIDERSSLEAAIVQYLKDHPGLRELQARRRQEALSERLSEQEAIEVIQDLVRADPTLASLFGRGEKVKVPIGPIPDPIPFEGNHFPTFFRLIREPKGGLIRRCPRNRSFVIEYETDAVNDYFSRARDRGRLDAQGMPAFQSVHVHNGKAQVRFGLPQKCNVGDQFKVNVSVTDVSRVLPFESEFQVVAEREAEPAPPGPRPTPSTAALTGLPNIVEVRRDKWDRYSFDEQSALLLKHGDEAAIDILVNMDNIHLRNEIARRRNLDAELLKFWFKYGLCLLAMGMLYQQRQAPPVPDSQTDEQDGESFEQIAEASRGLAVTVIPVISKLSPGRVLARK